MVPLATKLRTCTGRVWPRRCTRPMRCSRTAGFQGTSTLTTTTVELPMQNLANRGGRPAVAKAIAARRRDMLRVESLGDARDAQAGCVQLEDALDHCRLL
jgi:hypothetical protein